LRRISGKKIPENGIFLRRIFAEKFFKSRQSNAPAAFLSGCGVKIARHGDFAPRLER